MFFYFNRLLFKSISQLPLFTISRFSFSFHSFPVFFSPCFIFCPLPFLPSYLFTSPFVLTPMFLAILHSCLFLPLFLPILPFFVCFPPSHSTPSYFPTLHLCRPFIFLTSPPFISFYSS